MPSSDWVNLMALVYGDPVRRSKKQLQRMLLLPIIVCTTFILVDYITQTSIFDFSAFTFITFICLYALLVVHTNQQYLKKIWSKKQYKEWQNQEHKLSLILSQLSEETVVYRHLTLELIHIDALIISTQHIYILKRINKESFSQDIPHKIPVETLWKACHIINVILKKYFQSDYLPKPILYHSEKNISTIEYKEVKIIHIEKVIYEISRDLPNQFCDPLLHLRFSCFVRKRYM